MHKPFPWYGGKESLAPLLVSLLPEHRVYVEVFGGSGALLFAKDPSPIEVFNDLDSGVVNFFRVLRDPEQAEHLVALLELTPYAREEYYACLHHWQIEENPIEKARQWYCAVRQSMNSSVRATGWSCTKLPGSNPASKWHNGIARLWSCTSRLAQVQIDHRDFEQVLQVYDSPDTCFYLDPPYLSATRRKQHCYHHEMTTADHERLLNHLKTLQGMIILSGYAHPLYDQALEGWSRLEQRVACSSAIGAHASSSVERIECIWRNQACVQNSRSWSQPPLFVETV